MPDDSTLLTARAAGDGQGAPPCDVLVLESSRAQRQLLATMLRRWGYRVTICDHPNQALEVLEGSDIPIVLTDWILPDMTGPEFCRAFRAMQRESYGYVILLTSKTEKADLAQGLDAGADDFVAKPVYPPELRARIKAGQRIVSMQGELVTQNRKIRSTLAELRALYDALDRDLHEAKRLQESLVRETFRPVRNGSVALTLRSSGHVGGDLVGFFPIPGDRVGIFSLDVSGHGVTSALLAARMAGLLGTAAPEQNVALVQTRGGQWAALSPDAVARKLNDMMFAEVETDLYFTLCLCDVDLASGEVKMVQAGHPHPAILRADGCVDWIGSGGMPIGLLPDAGFDTVQFTLLPGERLLLHSDGFTECSGPSGGFLGDRGLAEMLSGQVDSKPEDFLPRLLGSLEAYAARPEFEDDVSAVCLHFTPQAPGAAR